MIDEKPVLVSKQVIVVDTPGGRLASLADSLRSLGFGHTLVGRLEEALELAKKDARVSLVAVDERVDRDSGPRFVATLRELHPGLPILWAAAGAVPRTQFAGAMPDALLPHDASAEVLEACLNRLLRQACYPVALLGELIARSVAVLREGFSTDVVASEPFLRANRVRLAPMNALVNFCGGDTRGHLLVSGSIASFATIRRSALPDRPDPSDEDAGDVAGELANQIMGRLAEYMRLHTSVALGVPLLIEGTDMMLRTTSGQPALVLPLASSGADAAALWVELYVEPGSPGLWSGQHPEAPPLAAGDVKFFPSSIPPDES